jgi:deazaflavin-dependent oxidoreductase (nitroreductase family)
MLSGGGERSDWVKNIRHDPRVTLRIGDTTFEGDARLVDDPAEDELARRMLFDKYQPTYGSDLTSWRRRALPVAVDLR